MGYSYPAATILTLYVAVRLGVMTPQQRRQRYSQIYRYVESGLPQTLDRFWFDPIWALPSEPEEEFYWVRYRVESAQTQVDIHSPPVYGEAVSWRPFPTEGEAAAFVDGVHDSVDVHREMIQGMAGAEEEIGDPEAVAHMFDTGAEVEAYLEGAEIGEGWSDVDIEIVGPIEYKLGQLSEAQRWHIVMRVFGDYLNDYLEAAPPGIMERYADALTNFVWTEDGFMALEALHEEILDYVAAAGADDTYIEWRMNDVMTNEILNPELLSRFLRLVVAARIPEPNALNNPLVRARVLSIIDKLTSPVRGEMETIL